MQALESKVSSATVNPRAAVRLWEPLLFGLAGVIGFHLAFLRPEFNALVLVYAFGLLKLTKLPSMRWAFRGGFAAGMLVFGPQLFWLWKIFGPVAICLWAVLSFFPALFVMGVYSWRRA